MEFNGIDSDPDVEFAFRIWKKDCEKLETALYNPGKTKDALLSHVRTTAPNEDDYHIILQMLAKRRRKRQEIAWEREDNRDYSWIEYKNAVNRVLGE
jgi:hypothetical protein